MAAGVVLAARNMASERRRAAALDGAHHLQLVEADVAAVGITPSGTVVAEDVRDLQHWTGHAAARYGCRLALALARLRLRPARRQAGRAGSRRLAIMPVATRV